VQFKKDSYDRLHKDNPFLKPAALEGLQEQMWEVMTEEEKNMFCTNTKLSITLGTTKLLKKKPDSTKQAVSKQEIISPRSKAPKASQVMAKQLTALADTRPKDVPPTGLNSLRVTSPNNLALKAKNALSALNTSTMVIHRTA
jgi:hypothetical protein